MSRTHSYIGLCFAIIAQSVLAQSNENSHLLYTATIESDSSMTLTLPLALDRNDPECHKKLSIEAEASPYYSPFSEEVKLESSTNVSVLIDFEAWFGEYQGPVRITVEEEESDGSCGVAVPLAEIIIKDGSKSAIAIPQYQNYIARSKLK